MSRYLKFLIALITLLTANLASAASPNPSRTVKLNKEDPRAMSSVTVAVVYKIDGVQYYDYEVVGDWNKRYDLELRQTTGTQDGFGIFRGDYLRITSTGSACTSDCAIVVAKTDSRVFTDVQFEISFVIDGDLHYDNESVTIPGRPAFDFGEDFLLNLNVDGRGMTWDGNEWVGNILSVPPQISSFYWDTNKVGYNSEIWAEGFISDVRVYYKGPSFPLQRLYNVSANASGVAHDVFSTEDCNIFRMRSDDMFVPQIILVADEFGHSASFQTNSLRPCKLQP